MNIPRTRSLPSLRATPIHPSIHPHVKRWDSLLASLPFYETDLLACFNLNDQICSNVTFIFSTTLARRLPQLHATKPPDTKNQQSTKPGWWLSLSRAVTTSPSPHTTRKPLIRQPLSSLSGSADPNDAFWIWCDDDSLPSPGATVRWSLREFQSLGLSPY